MFVLIFGVFLTIIGFGMLIAQFQNTFYVLTHSIIGYVDQGEAGTFNYASVENYGIVFGVALIVATIGIFTCLCGNVIWMHELNTERDKKLQETLKELKRLEWNIDQWKKKSS